MLAFRCEFYLYISSLVAMNGVVDYLARDNADADVPFFY